MAFNIAINGFGRMGKLAFRAGFDSPELNIVHINEIKGDAACHAHLIEFDSVHGTWPAEVASSQNSITVNGQTIGFSQNQRLQDTDWAGMGIDLVVDCTGKFKTVDALQPYFEQSVPRVLVSAPVADASALNVVYGVNDHLYDPAQHKIVTAASCTTNCLAPVVKVMHEKIGIKHGTMTTIHNITNTQTIVDKGHNDLRRARGCTNALIPTTTGSAKAITQIFPELTGKLNGVAVRVPLTNASLTDFVFEADRSVTVEEVNACLKAASESDLQGVLGFETRPLISTDYTNNPLSSIVDAPSTMVIDETQVKILAWYDNEWGYVNRMMEMAAKMARMAT